MVLQLLPGKVAFVRWNVGINRDASAGTLNLWTGTGIQPKIIAQAKRNHNRGVGATGVVSGWRPYRAGEGLSSATVNYTANVAPDTLYLFDADSNLTDDSTTVTNILPVDSLFPNSNIGNFSGNTPVYKQGLRIYSGYNFQTLGTGSVSGTRLRQIRVRGYIGTLPVEEDTLNSPVRLFLNGLSHYGTGGGVDSTIVIGPNLPYPDSTGITYRYNTSAATNFPSTALTSDQIKDSIVVTVTLKDQYGNLVNNGLLGLLASSPTITGLQWNSIATNRYLGQYLPGHGHATYGATYNVSTDTLWMRIRNDNNNFAATGLTQHWGPANTYSVAAADDAGKAAGMLINPCSTYPQDVITLTVLSKWASDLTFLPTYQPDTGLVNGTTYGFKVSALTYQTPPTPTYTFTINPGVADTIRIWSQTLGRDSSYAVRLTSLGTFSGSNWTSASGGPVDSVVTTNTVTGTRNVIRLFAKVKDRCGKNVIPTAAGDVTFSMNSFTFRKSTGIPTTAAINARIARGGATPDYGSLGATITGYLTTGAVVPTGSTVGVDAVNRVWADLTVPNIKNDTTIIKAYVTSNPAKIDSFALVTYSGPPANLSYYRATDNGGTTPGAKVTMGVNDSLIIASQGTVSSTVTYFVYDPFYDLVDALSAGTSTTAYNVGLDNATLPAADYTAKTGVVWRLNGPTRWSASLTDGDNYYGAATAIRGKKQMFRALTPTHNAFTATGGKLTVYSDTVAGSGTICHDLVFPVERYRGDKYDVFPTGTYTNDKLLTTYAWTTDVSTLAIDSTWYIPLKYTSTMSLVADAAFGGTSLNGKGRGYNALTGFIVWNGNVSSNGKNITTGQTTTVYETVPDTTQMRVAWLQGPFYLNGSSTATLPYLLTNDSTTLKTKVANTGMLQYNNYFFGRQGAANIGLYGSGASVSATSLNTNYLAKRVIIDSLVGYSTTDSLRNTPGQVDTFYVRQYDRFFNPYSPQLMSYASTDAPAPASIGDTLRIILANTKNTRMKLGSLYSSPDSTNQVWWQSGKGIKTARSGQPGGDSTAAGRQFDLASTATTKTDKVLMNASQGTLRGAWRVAFQTLFCKSDSTLNQGDTALFIAQNVRGTTWSLGSKRRRSCSNSRYDYRYHWPI